jgi:hypothetical protein
MCCGGSTGEWASVRVMWSEEGRTQTRGRESSRVSCVCVCDDAPLGMMSDDASVLFCCDCGSLLEWGAGGESSSRFGSAPPALSLRRRRDRARGVDAAAFFFVASRAPRVSRRGLQSARERINSRGLDLMSLSRHRRAGAGAGALRKRASSWAGRGGWWRKRERGERTLRPARSQSHVPLPLASFPSQCCLSTTQSQNHLFTHRQAFARHAYAQHHHNSNTSSTLSLTLSLPSAMAASMRAQPAAAGRMAAKQMVRAFKLPTIRRANSTR